MKLTKAKNILITADESIQLVDVHELFVARFPEGKPPPMHLIAQLAYSKNFILLVKEANGL